MFLFIIFLKLGEVILILFAMFLMLAAFLSIPGAIAYVLIKGKKNREAWGEVSNKLGLKLLPNGKLPMTGVYNDCPIEFSIFGQRRMGGYSGEIYHRRHVNYTYCKAMFPNNLRLSLKIETGKSSSGSIFMGLAGFDNAFDVRGYDREIVQRMLLTESPTQRTNNLVGDLMLAKESVSHIQIDDEGVYVQQKGVVTDLATIKNWLDITTYLAKRFYATRKNLPSADWEKQTIQAWQSLANQNNLSFDSKNLTLEGRYKNFPVRIAIQAETEKLQTEIKLKFPKSLMAGLKIMPDNAIHKALSWLGMQDIESGNKAFDDAFIVKAENDAVAGHKLRPDLCTMLLNINSKASNLLITDEEISVTFDSVINDQKILQSYLEAIVSTAQMFLR
jgi:hypothetical protein